MTTNLSSGASIVWRGHSSRSRFYVRWVGEDGKICYESASGRYGLRPSRIPQECFAALAEWAARRDRKPERTLTDLWRAHEMALELDGRSPATLAKRRGAFTRLAAAFGPSRAASSIRLEDAAAYKANAGNQVQWKHDVALLKNLLSRAGLDSNPLDRFRVKASPSRGVALSLGDFEKLNAAAAVWATDDGRKATLGFFKLLLLTGARPGEILSLLWTDITHWGVRINVLKRRRQVTKVVEINDAIASVLEDLKQLTRVREDQVFGIWGTDASARVTLGRFWRELRGLAGLGGIRLHDARHTVATVMTRSLGLRKAQEAVGHASYSTTERTYVHEDASARVDLTIMADFVKAN